jgi:hypothetical protein
MTRLLGKLQRYPHELVNVVFPFLKQQGGLMQIRVLNEKLDVLWIKTETGGVTNLSFRRDGTIEKIIYALQRALAHARAELNSPVDCAAAAVQNSKSLEKMLDR